MEKYYNKNGDVGVLISHDFGAGWSTWNTSEIAIDKRIIEEFLKNVSSQEMCNYIQKIGYDRPYMEGYSSLELEFIPRGVRFKIYEYDGYEFIMTENDDDFIMA